MQSVFNLSFAEIEKLLVQVKKKQGIAIAIPSYLQEIPDDAMFSAEDIAMMFANQRTKSGHMHVRTARRWFAEGLEGVGILPRSHPRLNIVRGSELKEFLWKRGKRTYLSQKVTRDRRVFDFLQDAIERPII